MKVHIGPREKFPLMSEINMIPLIDVSLVLLIIFMIMTPILVSSQIKINLPKAVTTVTADQEPLRVQITRQKTFYVGGQAVLEDDLASSIQSALTRLRTGTVLIEADANVPFDLVVRAMDQAKQQGAQKLGVAVAPKD